MPEPKPYVRQMLTLTKRAREPLSKPTRHSDMRLDPSFALQLIASILGSACSYLFWALFVSGVAINLSTLPPSFSMSSENQMPSPKSQDNSDESYTPSKFSTSQRSAGQPVPSDVRETVDRLLEELYGGEKRCIVSLARSPIQLCHIIRAAAQNNEASRI